MTKQEIEKKIVDKVLGFYRDFDKAIVSIYNYTFTENSGFTYPTRYYKNESMLNIDFNVSISDEIKSLLKYQFEQQIKSNKGTITIYPSGEYESEFIWDNEAHLEKLVFKAENLFSLLYYEISACPAFHNVQGEPISWQEATVIILFKSGKVQPLNVEVKTATNEIIHYSEAIEEEFGESEYQSSRQYYEETYHLMNEGELKALYQRWNVATIHIKYGVRFDFEKHVILEWKEENA